MLLYGIPTSIKTAPNSKGHLLPYQPIRNHTPIE